MLRNYFSAAILGIVERGRPSLPPDIVLILPVLILTLSYLHDSTKHTALWAVTSWQQHTTVTSCQINHFFTCVLLYLGLLYLMQHLVRCPCYLPPINCKLLEGRTFTNGLSLQLQHSACILAQIMSSVNDFWLSSITGSFPTSLTILHSWRYNEFIILS